MDTLRDDYIQAVTDRVTVSVEDLSRSELELVNASFDIFRDRLSDMKELQDQNKRLSLELANLRAYHDTSGETEDVPENGGTDD